MNKKFSWVIALFCLSVLPAPSHAQCRDKQDQFCRNLQYILYAAQTDFRPFEEQQQNNEFGLFTAYPKFPHFPKSPRHVKPDSPDVSLEGAKVPCQLTAWTNGVPMYMCEARVPEADAGKWYDQTMADLQQLQYLWNFKVRLQGTDHYVDAGPQDCDVPATDGLYITDGPYLGQCPLHIQTVRQADGTDLVHFWVTSYTSPFLARHQSGSVTGLSAAKSPSPATPGNGTVQQVSETSKAAPASQPVNSASASAVPSATDKQAPASDGATAASTATPSDQAGPDHSPAARAGCDEFCQNLKKVLEDRWTAFKELHTGKSVAPTADSSRNVETASSATLKLAGASSCSIKSLPPDPAHSAASAAVSRVRLTPANMKGKTAQPPATQYVCYWPESSPAAAESQFQTIVSLLEFLIPSTWSAQQLSQSDELSGAQVTVWSAHDASNEPAIRLYLSGQSVGLHVTSAFE